MQLRGIAPAISAGKASEAFRKPDRKKQDIKKRSEYLKNKKKEVSGVVVADKIAEAQISGVINEPVTPEKGNNMQNYYILQQKGYNR